MSAALPLFAATRGGPEKAGKLGGLPAARPETLNERVPAGRLSELSGAVSSGRMTAAVSLVIRAQEQDEPVVWVQPEDGALYPPDLAESGVDLEALVVVRVPLRGRAASARGGARAGRGAGRRGAGQRGQVTRSVGGDLARAAELLLRSGAFGLVVVDLGRSRPRGGAWQGRLAALARQHESRVVLLSEGEDAAPSLGPMVGLRIAPSRHRRGPGRFVIEHRVLKDKVGGGVPQPDRRRAPWGLA
ncbi:MAG: recombinase A [Deltaproteobacteria bacterium]|nr:recombinase A [Deltaproteobacteria bacterium]